MEIELQETLERNLKEGVNLFLGAGFSVYAKDQNDKNLPVGSQLANELTSKFNCPKLSDLTKVCTIIDSFDSEGLNDYLVQRFQVKEYDSIYNALTKIKSPRIFTTNIDNLVEKIFETTNQKYINNVFLNGACFQDNKCVDYIPIHGCVNMPEMKFLFNKQEVSGSFRTELSAWVNLNQSANQLPSVFLGYSLEDVGAIESLFGSKGGTTTQKDKWILLREKDPGNIAYFKALGFKIIIGDTKDFLVFVNGINFKTEIKSTKKDYIEEIYPEARVPVNKDTGRIRQIDEFFMGSAPIWSDILSNRIYKTSHLDTISNFLEKTKNLIITGIPASGKSTLLLQLAKKMAPNKRILFFKDLTPNKSNIIRNEIKMHTIILVDNFTSDIDSFVNLSQNKFIKLVGFDRYYNVDISVHKLPEADFFTYDVSDLTPQDIQGIFNTIPLSIRKKKMITKKEFHEIPSIFEIVNYNIDKPDIKDRYKDILLELDETDPILLELLIMTCYVHSCRTPVSFEVINSYLSDEISSFHEVQDYLDSLKGMVQEAIGDLLNDIEEDQDYYQPRSQILAETIIEQTKSKHFKRVFEKFHDYVPKHQIPNFHVFKRQGYDAYYVGKAFYNWKAGLEFYERAYQTDKNPFLLQQCSLYLLRKKRYSEAALKIDRALQTSYKRIFSIENTHAIILFKANINLSSNDPSIRATLDRSMEILKECYNEDQRKTYHALTFAEQSIDYFSKYPDEKAMENLKLAKNWLEEISNERKFYSRFKKLYDQIAELV
jgi:tetratricopeptide (TPR) repeat protein/energy-coupling factor transporter ATP-binding protein EcfA2